MINIKNRVSLVALSFLALSCSNALDGITKETAEKIPANKVDAIQYHVDKAHALAGDSFMKITAELQCTSDKSAAMKYFADKTVPPATQVFDNLFYVGVLPVGAWAIQTSEGIILLDALNNADEAENVIEAGLLDLGLNPKDIKYIVVTHGHGDHYGGTAYLAEKFGARIIMDEQDWEIALNPRPMPAGARKRPNWPKPPAKDMVSSDGQQLTLGDTTVTLFNTPGHTEGTISVMFPVTEKGNTHTAALWGGTGFPRDKAGINDYVKSTEKFTQYIKNNKVDVVLSNHPFVDNSVNRMVELKANPTTNPFVIGNEASITYAQILGECAKAAYLR